jgi:hypothetical protein
MNSVAKIFFLVFFLLVSQGFCGTWEHTYGRKRGDTPRAVMPTSDGGYLITEERNLK